MDDAVRRESGRSGFRTQTRLWLCAVLWALPASGCFSTHGGPQDSTETGNPPVLDMHRVALKVSADTVHVTGEKGAVTPGGAAIEITNLTTGEVTKAKANPDGSFNVKVNGSPNDAFVVRAGTGQGGAASAPVYVVRGSAAVGSGADGSLSCEQRDSLALAAFDRALADADKSCASDADCQVVDGTVACQNTCPIAVVSGNGAQQLAVASKAIEAGLCPSAPNVGCPAEAFRCPLDLPAMCVSGQCVRMGATGSLSCQEREQMAGQQIAKAIQSADTSCTVDADCVTVSTATVCHDACGPTVVSQAGQAVIDGWVTRIDRVLCGSFMADGCQFSALPCAAPVTGVTACNNGQCVLNAGSQVGPVDCTSCLAKTLEWGFTGGYIAYEDHSTLGPCVHYTHHRQAACCVNAPGPVPPQVLMSCENDFDACTAITSSGAVLSALANADVQQALAGTTLLYGSDPRHSDGAVFEIKIGSRVIDVGGSCDGAPPNCIPVPPSVQALVDLLTAIDKAELETAACRSFLPECNSIFDAGSGSGTVQVFWHDPISQACLPRAYNGTGGNDNRFNAQAACEAHCGTPAASNCATDRTWQAVCTRCGGLESGCSARAQACAKPCTADVDCASDSVGTKCGMNQVCEAVSFCGM
jgi:hypothetical protein